MISADYSPGLPQAPPAGLPVPVPAVTAALSPEVAGLVVATTVMADAHLAARQVL